MTNIIAALNPSAGRGRTAALKTLIERKIKIAGFNPEMVSAAQPGDIGRAARRSVQRGDPFFVAAGGDGTMNEAANALAYSETALALIPTGTANILALELGIPTNPARALDLLVPMPHIEAIDLGLIGERYFSIAAGTGYGESLLKHATNRMKGRLGMASYYWSALRSILDQRLESYRLTVDGETFEAEAMAVVVANISRLGPGWLRFGRNVSPKDGLLDLAVFSVDSVFSGGRAVIDQFTGRENPAGKIRYWKAREIEVVSQHPTPYQADGESLGCTPFTAVVAPGALRFVSPLAH